MGMPKKKKKGKEPPTLLIKKREGRRPDIAIVLKRTTGKEGEGEKEFLPSYPVHHRGKRGILH